MQSKIGHKIIGILTDLLKPSQVESIFARYTPVSMRIHNSDLKIMKYLLPDPRMMVEVTKQLARFAK